MIRLIDADELKYRIQRDVERTSAMVVKNSGTPYVNLDAIMGMIDECPTRKTEDGYIPCEYGDYPCYDCKYHHKEMGCLRPGGRTDHGWNHY